MQTQIPTQKITKNNLMALISSLQEMLEEREWDEIVSQPHVMQWIVEKSRQARKEHQAGKTREWSFKED
jgi:hypothetical protein